MAKYLTCVSQSTFLLWQKGPICHIIECSTPRLYDNFLDTQTSSFKEVGLCMIIGDVHHGKTYECKVIEMQFKVKHSNNSLNLILCKICISKWKWRSEVVTLVFLDFNSSNMKLEIKIDIWFSKFCDKTLKINILLWRHILLWKDC